MTNNFVLFKTNTLETIDALFGGGVECLSNFLRAKIGCEIWCYQNYVTDLDRKFWWLSVLSPDKRKPLQCIIDMTKENVNLEPPPPPLLVLLAIEIWFRKRDIAQSLEKYPEKLQKLSYRKHKIHKQFDFPSLKVKKSSVCWSSMQSLHKLFYVYRECLENILRIFLRNEVNVI